MARIASIQEDPYSIFLEAADREELRRVLNDAWTISLGRRQVEVSVVCAKIRVFLNSTYQPDQLDKLADLYAEALSKRGVHAKGDEPIIDIRL